ncbi:hypothetical protein A1D17_29410 [Pseudomonas fluorescens]|uniref:Uncharacterized protein n=1 Tax=Pseudomonas fluorescens TaxID=294 RepID=A0A166QCW3_PSEFL|nr:hypothetical protein A1D17_29410 [Pseudomonas fluorescens]
MPSEIHQAPLLAGLGFIQVRFLSPPSFLKSSGVIWPQLLVQVIVTIKKRKFWFVGQRRKIAPIEDAAQ